MKQLLLRLSRFVALATLFSTFFLGLAQAAPAPSPEVVKGLTWLQAQVQAAGTLTNEATSIATPLQSRSETLQTLKLLATVPDALADQLYADSEDNTEYLARRAVTLSLAGRDASAITALLAVRQNLDGGFGGTIGYESNALDTAWAMLAMAQNSLSASTAAQSARNYLMAAIQPDGGVGAGSDYARVNANAVALLALQMSTPNLNMATALKQINTWLLLKQGIDGSWMGDSYLTALSLSAVSPLVTDAAIRTIARNYLTGLQGADGSWGADPFLTAVVLRALAFEPTTAPALALSVIGQVVDQKTATALGGATVSLSGAATATITTSSDGRFSLSNLTAGSYALQVSKAGYVSYTKTHQLNAGQVLDAGAIILSQLQATGIVRGQVIAATTGKPLSGVIVLLNGGAASTITDAGGLYEFVPVVPGVVTLDANILGYTPVSGSGNLLAGQTLVFSPALFTTTETAPNTGHFSGKVVAAGGSGALAGVSIEMNGAVAGVTAADGSFDLILPPASYVAAFTLAGYDSASTNFLLTAGAVVNAGKIALSQQLASTTISGVVKDLTSAKPINGAQVQVLNGLVATTGVDGVYSLSGLTGTTFTLRVSATGYATQMLQLQVSKPSNIVQDIALEVQAGTGLSLEPLLVKPGSAASRTDISIGTTVSNAATGTPVAAVLTMQVLNGQGGVVSSAIAYEKTGVNLVGVFTLNASEQLPVMFRWNTGQFPAGTYSLIARVVEAGTINQTTPLGRMLAEAQGTLTITADQHFSGTVAANPPVLQINTNTPVQLSAILTNDGNTVLPAQAYQLQVIDEKTGTAIATQQVNGNSFPSSDIQSLTFADWMPVAGGGNYRLELKAASDSTFGKIIGKVYVGDAATAAFTVNKLAVPVGTQAVKGKIHVNGQDATQGTISDPLAPLIKVAVQKAVTYNDAIASNWYSSNKCLGCHVVSQALVGGELNRKITTFNASQRQILFNALTTSQQTSGAIYASHPEFARTQTILGLWALSSWYKKDEVISPMAKAADYLIGQQETAGSWTADHVSGWWPTRTANTGITLKSMVEVDALIKQTPSFVGLVTYSLTSLISGGTVPGNNKGSVADAAGNIYVTSYSAGTLSLVKPGNTVQILLTGLSGPRPPAFGSDGALYIPTGAGVIKYLLAGGQKTTLTSIGATGVALGPDGNMYVANFWHNKITMITPAGTVSDYIVGGGLSNPHGVAFDQTGALLVANAGNYKVLKYNADKTYTQPIPSASGEPYFILPDGANYLVATSSGLYRYNAAWQAEMLVSGLSWSLAKTPDGRILVGNNSNALYVLQQNSMQMRLDKTITNATNWLLADSNIDTNNHIDLAMRLTGLGSAQKYYTGSAMATTLQIKMEQIGTLLRSRQRSDGGWGWRNGNTSDSMVTAQVGVALDYLNPSPNDPVVQNAIKLLLKRQLADGSWISENGVLSTHLAATTWVAIWLPIALDRIAGIDTDLTVAMPANVNMTNPAIAPTSGVLNAAGGKDYTWKLQGVTSAGLDLSFDLSLADMVLGETRPVAIEAYMTFNNSFTHSTVKAPVTVPRVTASAFLDLGVTTDKISYGANSPVSITAMVNNTAVGPLDGSVKLEIYGADNVLAAVVGTQPFSGLAAGAQSALGAIWSTGTTATGGYYVQAALYDAQNRQVGTARSVFDVVASTGSGTPTGSTAVGAKVTLDKLSYLPFDSVKISGRISNLTQNEVQSGLQAVFSVYLPDGTRLWTRTGALQQLLAGSFIDLGYGSQLSAAPAGQYKVTLSVLNPAAVEVARAETFFNVLSTAGTGSGLKGVITVTPQVMWQTTPVILGAVSNLGNADLTALPIRVSIVDPATQRIMLQQAYSPDIAQGKSFQTALGWNTETATIGTTYVAILTASVAGKDIMLASANIQIIEPPVKLDVKQETVRENRVLVWLACDPDNEGEADDSHDDGKPVSKSSNDDDQHKKAACLQNRTAFLQNLLTSLNVEYLITSTRDDFRNAFRGGRYNTYWLSGKGNNEELSSGKDSAHKETVNEDANDNDLAKEIREAVYRGDGLVFDGKQPGLAKSLQESLGIKNEGQLSLVNTSATTSNLLFTTAQLLTMGRAQKTLVTSGIAQANFDVPIKNSSDSKPALIFPAIISNDYGKGHAITFAFDLVDTLKNNAATTSWTQVLQTGLSYTLPPLPDPYSAGAYVALNTHIQNLARTVDLNVNTQLPMGATLLQTAFVATLDANGQPAWRFQLPENASQTLKLSLRLPALTGSHTARTYIDNLRYGISKRYGEYAYNWTVAASGQLASKLVIDLQALVLKKGEEREARNQTVTYLNKATALIGNAQYAEALEALLKAVDELRKISSVDISSYRLSLDTLLQETAWNWLRTTRQQG